MEFTGDTDLHEFSVPFNSSMPYLYTGRGSNVANKVQDYSLGSLMLTVQNQLTASPSVTPSVEVLIFVRLRNVRVYEANPCNCLIGFAQSGTSAPVGPIVDSDFLPKTTTLKSQTRKYVAQGPEDPPTKYIEEEDSNTQDPKQTEELTQKETKISPPVPYVDERFAKFPSPVRDVHELMRRYVPLNPRMINYAVGFNLSKKKTGDPTNDPAIQYAMVPIMPIHPLCNYYAAWAGSLHYRVYVAGAQISKVSALFHPESVNDALSLQNGSR
jgi:hypothetical protein